MNEDTLTPDYIYNKIWLHLKQGEVGRDDEYHSAVFSSININNQPTARIVIIRNINKEKKLITFNTDYRSPKIKEIGQNNQCLLLFYSAKLKEQIRIKVLSSIEYQSITAKKSWRETQLMSRKCYLSSIAPSTTVSNATDGLPIHLKGKEPNKEESEVGINNFAVVFNYIQTIDWLYLSSNGHKRILFSWNQGKRINQWIVP